MQVFALTEPPRAVICISAAVPLSQAMRAGRKTVSDLVEKLFEEKYHHMYHHSGSDIEQL